MSDTITPADQDESSVPYWPMDRSADRPFDPPPEILDIAAQRPVFRVRIWDGSTPWMVTGHAEQRSILSDPRTSADTKLDGFPHWSEHHASLVASMPRSVVTADGAEHTKFRRMMAGAFTTKRVMALRPEIQRVNDELIDDMLAGPQPADLVQALALPLPSGMICGLLGVPYADHDFFQEQTSSGLDRYAVAQPKAGIPPMSAYMSARLQEKIDGELGEDALSDLARLVMSADLTHAEGASYAQALLSAGHETSANMIALGTLALFEHPDQLALLRENSDDPSFVSNAVEEMLRYLSIIHNGQRRVAVADIELGGELIKAGEGIIWEVASGNWDANVFPEPDRLDLNRQGARQHHAFGYGIHQCIGQQLARVELQVVFGSLFKRVPTLKLATKVDQIPFKHDKLAYGVYELPVSW